MAADTKAERSSASRVLEPGQALALIPGVAGISAAERQDTALVYRGILAGANASGIGTLVVAFASAGPAVGFSGAGPAVAFEGSGPAVTFTTQED